MATAKTTRKLVASDSLAFALAKEVKARREENGWTFRDMATASGVNHSSLSLIEQGKSDPTTETIEKIASAFGIAASELIQSAESRKSAIRP